MWSYLYVISAGTGKLLLYADNIAMVELVKKVHPMRSELYQIKSALTQVHCKKWLATSFGIDLLCAVSRCGVKPLCHHLLLFIVKSLTGNTELVHTQNQLGDSVTSLYADRVDWHGTVSTRLLDWVVSRWHSTTREHLSRHLHHPVIW